jgi:uncharacterized repeat protein (TIGR03803 family)
MSQRITRTICTLAWIGAIAGIGAQAQTFTTLVNFNIRNGASPGGILVQGVDGNFYGTTARGPYGEGTIFRMSPQG